MTPIKDTDYLAVSAWLHAMETAADSGKGGASTGSSQ